MRINLSENTPCVKVDKCVFLISIYYVIKINGTKIRSLRKSKNLTIKELSEQVGLSSSAIGMYERGMRTPDIETIMLLSRFFSVDIEYFLDGTNNYMWKELGLNSLSNKVISTTKIQNTLIIEQALKRANGNCELCYSRAPFICNDGTPYLETYLFKKNSSEEVISINNIAAVCPNCRKKLEILQPPGDILFLQQQIKKKNQIDSRE